MSSTDARTDAKSIKIGTCMEEVTEQCLRRGLRDCGLWLSELALSASEELLASCIVPSSSSSSSSSSSPYGTGSPRKQTAAGAAKTPLRAKDSAAAAAPLLVSHGWLRALLELDTALVSPPPPTTTTKGEGVMSATRVRLYHRVALNLFLKGEFQRCHYTLARALREAEESLTNGVDAAASSPSSAAAAAGDVLAAWRGVKDASGAAAASPALVGEAALFSASFATSPLPPALLFLCLYALYMDGQKGKNTSANPHRAMNPHLRLVRGLLADALQNPVNQLLPTGGGDGAAAARLQDKDPYLCWLMGVVLRDLGMQQQSATYLLAAVARNPFLWCAWEDLGTLVTREAQLAEMGEMLAALEPRFMWHLFAAQVRTALGVAPTTTTTAAAAVVASPLPVAPTRPGGGREGERKPPAPPPQVTWELLLQHFPRSLYLGAQLAGYHYHLRKELDTAEQLYATVHRLDPYYLDCTPDYSNILFVKSNHLALSSLAQKVYHVDPFRAESNFVVGNYYVFLGEHERSVLHFRRATAIDPLFVAAWTLLGHAYVETKNTTAAVEAYRTAVDIDQRDYRGWYNLGQLYELLQAYHHALYYYWRTTALRPADPRMWAAVANCLEHDGRLGESIACLERAESYEPPQSEVYPAMVRRISTYYIDRRIFTKACVYLDKLVRSRAASEEDRFFALPFLIQHHTVQARQLVELPARSPSYDPFNGEYSNSNNNNNNNNTQNNYSSQHNNSNMAPSVSRGGPASPAVPQPPPQKGIQLCPTVQHALQHLQSASAYLEQLVALVQPSTTTGSSSSSTKTTTMTTTTAASPGSNMIRFVAQMQQEVAISRQAIDQRCPGALQDL